MQARGSRFSLWHPDARPSAEYAYLEQQLDSPLMTIEINHESLPLQSAKHAGRRAKLTAMWFGARHKCPRCGRGPMMKRYLQVAPSCPICKQELHHHRADDAPPYFTMFIVGHIVVPMILIVEKFWAPALWVHLLLWGPLTLAMTLLLLPSVKGAIVGLQWAIGMHGFGIEADGQQNLHLSSTDLDQRHASVKMFRSEDEQI